MIRVAIVGLAHPHVTYLLTEIAHRPELRLVAVAERDADLRARYLGDADADVVVHDHHDTLLTDHEVDVVAICGIYAERADAVVAALRAGAHVVADKPLCTELDQLAAIEKTAAETGRMVSVMFEKRFYPSTLAVRRLIDAGVLGVPALIASTGPHKLNRATRPDWFFRRDGYGGITGDLPVHDIDLVLLLSGATDGTVSALAGNARLPELPEFSDHTAVLLNAGDIAATIEANWLSPEAADVHGHYRMRIAGTEGTAEIDWAYNRLDVATHTRAPWQEPLGERKRAAEDFFDAVLAGTSPEVDTAASLTATGVALLAQRSADSGGEVLRWTRRGES